MGFLIKPRGISSHCITRFLGAPLTSCSISQTWWHGFRAGTADVVIDNGGPGRVVGNMLVARGTTPFGLRLSAQGRRTTAPDRLLVSQGELIHTTVKLSQQGILKLAPRLQGMATIRDELQKFMVKVSLRGHETFGNFLPGSHDDLIYALSLSCWYANSPWGLEIRRLPSRRSTPLPHSPQVQRSPRPPGPHTPYGALPLIHHYTKMY